MKYYECGTGSLHFGDVMSEIGKLADKSVNCVITSPPYWQLRDYGYPEQWGLEPTFPEYLEHLWSLMDEIWRVLKDDGTVFINLGDTYSTQSGQTRGTEYGDAGDKNVMAGKELIKGKLPNKCLLLIPHRFAIGCIDRGWIMRNDIIWAKRNGMPESCQDRFSKKHEYIFFMVKSQKYYFDLDGVRKVVNLDSVKRKLRGISKQNKYNDDGNTLSNPREYQGYENIDEIVKSTLGPNPGDVSDFWDIPTSSSKSKHYATYNTQLIDKPIIAGCPEGGVILDPFNGTGTTTLRSEQLNRKWIGIDGSAEYCEIAKHRIIAEQEQLKMDI